MGARNDGRRADELRPVTLTPDWQLQPAGSCLVEFGATRILCSGNVEEGAPRWRDRAGWVTGEYAMLPGATNTRARRGPNGRAKEIERLIGRSLRMAVDLDALPDVTLTVDCDVLDADGGTRTAAITGGWVALARALRALGHEHALKTQIAAVSVGIIDGEARLDLPYEEDVRAEVDMNIVMTGDGRFVEVQGTAEAAAFGRDALDAMLDLAVKGCGDLFAMQRHAFEA